MAGIIMARANAVRRNALIREIALAERVGATKAGASMSRHASASSIPGWVIESWCPSPTMALSLPTGIELAVAARRSLLASSSNCWWRNSRTAASVEGYGNAEFS
jgi:hypothetical protein